MPLAGVINYVFCIYNNSNEPAYEEVPTNTEKNTEDGRRGEAGIRSQVRQTVARLHQRVCQKRYKR